MPVGKPGARYAWNRGAQRYIDRTTGRFVSRRTISRVMYFALRRANAEMRTLSLALQAGQITIASWQLGMAAKLKDAHLYSAAIARGGWAQLTPSDYGHIGSLLRERYAFLNRFARQLANGDVPLDGRFLVRAGMYADGARTMRHRIERVAMLQAGMTEEQNVEADSEHCTGCDEATAMGWVAIGELPEIGDRDCLTNCQCEIEYRERAGADAAVV